MFHMLPENSVKFNTAHTYLVARKNTVNGWTWLAKMESAPCSRIESMNKNTTQFPSATFLIHLSYAFRIHHALHCNSAQKAHTKETFWVLKSADWMTQVTEPGRKSKYIPSLLLQAANMILAEWICPLCEFSLPIYLTNSWINLTLTTFLCVYNSAHWGIYYLLQLSRKRWLYAN